MTRFLAPPLLVIALLVAPVAHAAGPSAHGLNALGGWIELAYNWFSQLSEEITLVNSRSSEMPIVVDKAGGMVIPNGHRFEDGPPPRGTSTPVPRSGPIGGESDAGGMVIPNG